MRQNKESLQSRGPYTFETQNQLAQNESEYFDFFNRDFGKRKRYFRPYLPFDSFQITNRSSSSAIEVTLNGQYTARVLPNTIETFSDVGVTKVNVENIETTTIDAGEIILEGSFDAYDADDKAREEAMRGTLSNVVEKFTGVRL